MLLLAIVTAQALDPARIVVLGIIFGLTRLADNRTVGHLGLVFGAQTSALAGLLSNAFIIAVLMGLARFWRGRFA